MGRTIEVKSTSRLQAWKQKQLSSLRIVLSPTRKWDSETGEMEKEPTFNADLYVFCYFKPLEYSTANLLDLTQWEFIVLTHEQIIVLFKARQSISLKSLQKQGIKSLTANQLKEAIKNK